MPTKTWTPDDLERCRHLEDHEADAAVATVSADDGEERGRQLLTKIIHKTAHLPQWADNDLITEAEAVFEKHGWATFGLLAALACPRDTPSETSPMCWGRRRTWRRTSPPQLGYCSAHPWT
jgi:hypothetical protein